MLKMKIVFGLLFSFFLFSCEEKISKNDLEEYKSMMDIRLGHLGNAIIMQGRLLDSFNLSNERADEDHFKEAEELVKSNLESFGRIHNSLIEASELLISAGNALEDNAWLGGSVSFAERNLDTARVAFQKAVKVVYAIEDGKEIKPEMEYKEYEVGDKPEKFQFKK